MAVALRGSDPLAYSATEPRDATYTAGTTAGDVAFLWAPDSWKPRLQGPPRGSGWTPTDAWTFWKALTAADATAGEVSVMARLLGLYVLSGASRIGRVVESRTVKVRAGGAAIWVVWLSPRYSGDPGPATNRLGSVVVAEDGYKHSVYFRTAVVGQDYLYIDGLNSRAQVMGFEIVPAEAPAAPTLISPASESKLDRTAAAMFTLQHNSSGGAPMTAAKVRARVAGTGTWYYLTASGTLTTTEASIATSTPQFAANANVFAAGNWEWTAATDEFGTFSAYAPVSTFTAVNPPTVTSITVTSTAGSLRPTIAFTLTAGYGGLTASRVRITPSAATSPAAPIWDSLVQRGDDLSMVAPAKPNADGWTNGQSLAAWVEVLDGGVWSAPTKDDDTFTVSWTAPATPTINAATPAVGPLEVTVGSIQSGANGVEVWTSVDADTEPWQLLASVTPDATSEVVRVPHAPYGVGRDYRAAVWVVSDGVRLYSDWVQLAAPVASYDTATHLIRPDGTYLTTHLLKPGRVAPRIAHRVATTLGAAFARVDSTLSAGLAGSGTTVLSSDPAERATLRAWLTDGTVLGIRWSPEFVRGALADHPLVWVKVIDPEESYYIDRPNAERAHSFGWVEQAAPTYLATA